MTSLCITAYVPDVIGNLTRLCFYVLLARCHVPDDLYNLGHGQIGIEFKFAIS